MKICCVGIAILDRIFNLDSLPKEEGKFFAKSFIEAGGGPAATAAVACSRLGIEVDMIARVGDDDTGKTIINGLKEENVGVDTIQIIKQSQSTQATILVDNNGNRIIVSYPSPSLGDDLSFIDTIDFSQYDIILADVRWHNATKKIFEIAKKLNITTVLDADTTPQDISDLVELASHNIFSEPGLSKFANTNIIDDGLLYAAKKTSGNVYVTLGKNGYKYLKNDRIIHKPSFIVNAVDTTGAGDVFHGAFASALCLNKDIESALRFAAATAAIKCTKPGGRNGIPCLKDVEDFCIKN